MSDIFLIPMNETVEQTYERGYAKALADAKRALANEIWWIKDGVGNLFSSKKQIMEKLKSLEVKP